MGRRVVHEVGILLEDSALVTTRFRQLMSAFHQIATLAIGRADAKSHRAGSAQIATLPVAMQVPRAVGRPPIRHDAQELGR